MKHDYSGTGYIIRDITTGLYKFRATQAKDAKEIKRVVRQWQSSVIGGIEFVDSFPVTDIYQWSRLIHSRFAKQNQGNNWYKLTDAELRKVGQL